MSNFLLYLLPSSIGSAPLEGILPANYSDIINQIDAFIVEDLRTARRFLRRAGFKKDFDLCQFLELNEHNKHLDFEQILKQANLSLEDFKIKHWGLLSEAGVPCVADPGSKAVAWAHSKSIQVKPIVGPSSLILALMASGFNGQNFHFHGYLPIEPQQKNKLILDLEKNSRIQNTSQIFIETPYRNLPLFQSFLEVCQGETSLCIASNIGEENEYILSLKIKEWRKLPPPPIHKVNTVFLLYSYLN